MSSTAFLCAGGVLLFFCRYLVKSCRLRASFRSAFWFWSLLVLKKKQPIHFPAQRGADLHRRCPCLFPALLCCTRREDALCLCPVLVGRGSQGRPLSRAFRRRNTQPSCLFQDVYLSCPSPPFSRRAAGHTGGGGLSPEGDKPRENAHKNADMVSLGKKATPPRADVMMSAARKEVRTETKTVEAVRDRPLATTGPGHDPRPSRRCHLLGPTGGCEAYAEPTGMNTGERRPWDALCRRSDIARQCCEGGGVHGSVGKAAGGRWNACCAPSWVSL